MLSNSGCFVWSLIIILAFHSLAAHCQFSRDDWVSIDCGSVNFLVDDNLIIWDTDDLYTDAGINKVVRVNQPLQILNTLRAFPSSADRNCYDLPVYQQKLRYLVRSAFLYGDYDSLSRPPTFDLRFDGKMLSTVQIPSIAAVVIDEVVYTSEESGVINLCLVQRNDGGVPFVSAIQAVPADAGLYSNMPLNDNFGLVARINYGESEDGSSNDDNYERFWTPGTTPSNCNNVTSFIDVSSPSAENDPPLFVLADAIESMAVTSPIILSVDFPQSSHRSQSAYFVFYFTETNSGNNRTMHILIDGQNMSTVTTDPTKCTVVTLYPVVVTGPTVNVTLAAADPTGWPPLINAMEVFSKISTSGGGRNRQIHVASFVLMLCVLAMAAW